MHSTRTVLRNVMCCRKYFDKQSKLFLNVANERLQNKIDRESREKGRPATPTLRELRDWAHTKIDPTFQDFWGVCLLFHIRHEYDAH